MRRALLIPLAGSLILALGASGTSPSDARARRMRFKKPVKVSADDSETAAEPSIRAARDGNIYIVAPTGLGNIRPNDDGGGDVLWRSTNGGKTWKFLGSFDNQAGGGDSDIAVDRAGNLWGSGLTLVNTTAAYSSDQGENWNVNPVSTLDTSLDRQWDETYKAENFSFMTTGQTNDMRIVVSRLELTPGDVPTVMDTVTASNDGEVYQWPGEITVDEKNDFVFVTYNTDEKKKRHDDVVVVRYGLDLTNRKHFVVTNTKGDTFDSFTAMDVDRAGNLYVTWSERRPKGKHGRRGKTGSYLSISHDHGKTWTRPFKINRRPRTTTFPWLVAGSKNRVALAYYGTRSRGPSPEKVAFPAKKPPKWKVWVAYSTHANKGRRAFKEKVATPKPIHKGDVCTSGTGCASGTRDLLDFFQIDLDACGKAVIAYTDNSRDKVIVGGSRPENKPELIYFVRQRSGPRFYKRPLNAKVC